MLFLCYFQTKVWEFQHLVSMEIFCHLGCEFPNGYCDDKNNNKKCEFDGGDCCGSNVNKNFCTICQCLDPNHSGFTEYITLELGKFKNNQLILSSIQFQDPQSDNQRIKWKIEAPGNKIVVLQFIFFQTGNGKVALHDGTNKKRFTLIKELSGNNINQKILYGTTGNEMVIEFDSDDTENGFEANITGKEI